MRITYKTGLTLAALTAVTPALAGSGSVTLEIPKVDVFPYRKPYVALWLEDGNGQQVKMLSVLHDQSRVGGRWLPELRSWWRAGGRAMTMPADGISRPTQAPGQQSIAIPGIDALAPGRYSVVVEAAREKGGRELVKVPFELKRGKSASATASGDTELGKVSVSIRP